MTAISLGMPKPPAPKLAERRKTRQIKVGNVLVGGDAPVSVQSMTTTKTADVNATLQQIAELTAAGCQIVRVAVPDTDDVEALPAIAQQVADPGDRRHPLPASVRLRGDRRRLRRGAGQPGQHQEVRRQGRRDRQGGQGTPGSRSGSASTPAPGQAADGEVRQGHRRGAGRVGAVGVLAVRGARLPRHQDLGQAQRPGRDGQRLPAALPGRATIRCTSA